MATACSQPVARPVVLEVRVPEYATTESFGARLFHQYATLAPRLSFRFVPTAGTSTVDLFARGDADIAVTSADAAYFAFRTWGTRDARHQFNAIAALQLVPMHLVIGPDAHSRRVSDLRRIAFMNTTPVTNRFNERVAGVLGVGAAVPVPSASFRSLEAPFQGGDFDAVLLSGDYPAPAVQRWLDEGARLTDMPDDAIARLRHDYPFIHPMSIPAGTYRGQPDPIRTFGIQMVLVCRRDLGDDVVYELSRQLFAVLAQLRHQYPELRRLGLAQTLSTPIPLHPGAAAFYRELELGS